MAKIRDILMDEIDKLRKGTADLKTSKTIVKAAAQVIYNDRLVMEEKVHTLKTKKFIKGL